LRLDLDSLSVLPSALSQVLPQVMASDYFSKNMSLELQ
jgi:hypothetical protein